MFRAVLDRGAADVAGTQADGHEWRNHHALVDLDHAIDHDLPVDQVDAGRHHDRGPRSRSARAPSPAGGRPRQHGHAAALQARLQPVERLPEVGVADEGEAEHLPRGVGARGELVPLSAVVAR
jgi:hypothetical protein